MSDPVQPTYRAQSKFRAAIRWWKNDHPDIVCVCVQCFQFGIFRDTYALRQWVEMHAGVPCAGAMMPTDFTEQIEKALAEVRVNDVGK